MDRRAVLLRRIRFWLVGFMIALAISGLTAFPIEYELNVLARMLGVEHVRSPTETSGLRAWIVTVRNAVADTNARYPFLAYGTDWLAFAHLVLAIAFVGPLRDPVRNRWVVTFGIIACVCVIPLALIAGPVRGIPLYWRMIDCAFGVLGLVPLLLCRRYIAELERTDG